MKCDEMKAYKADVTIPVYGTIADAEVYLKSEADKVIADKDKEIQRLENLCESYRIDCDNLAISEANAYKEIERDNKRIRHQKFKRCLAMADYSMYHHFRMLEIYGKRLDNDRAVFKINFGLKWRHRWLKLAEKFKPDNSTAQ